MRPAKLVIATLLACACGREQPAPASGAEAAAPAPAPAATPATPAEAEPEPAPAPAPERPPLPGGREPADEAERQAVIATEGAARKLGGILKDRVQKAMSDGAPASAASTCAGVAQEITADVARVTGVAVGRASVRLRNPKNAPPAWVDAWLRHHEGAPAAEVSLDRWIVDTPEGAVARVILPIAVEPLCVTCHGPLEGIDAGVREVLAARYPGDAATGYAVGDLRGALWAERAVEP